MESYRWQSRIGRPCVDREEDAILQEYRCQCLMLTSKRNAIHFELDVKLRTFRNGIERMVEAEADASLTDNMNVSIKTPSASGNMDLYQNLVAYMQRISRQ